MALSSLCCTFRNYALHTVLLCEAWDKNFYTSSLPLISCEFVHARLANVHPSLFRKSDACNRVASADAASLHPSCAMAIKFSTSTLCPHSNKTRCNDFSASRNISYEALRCARCNCTIPVYSRVTTMLSLRFVMRYSWATASSMQFMRNRPSIIRACNYKTSLILSTDAFLFVRCAINCYAMYKLWWPCCKASV